MTENKEVKEVKKAKKYPIINYKVLGEGYYAKIDGVHLTVDPQERNVVTRGGKRVFAVTKKSAVFQTELPIVVDEETGATLSGGKEAVPNEGEYLVDLTKEQIRQLAIVGMIAVPKNKDRWKAPTE